MSFASGETVYDKADSSTPLIFFTRMPLCPDVAIVCNQGAGHVKRCIDIADIESEESAKQIKMELAQ